MSFIPSLFGVNELGMNILKPFLMCILFMLVSIYLYKLLKSEFQAWLGQEPLVDDVYIIGLKV